MSRREAGFSLVELMTTVAIISLLASVAMPALHYYASKSKRAEAHMGLGTIGRLQDQHYQSKGIYAASLKDLEFSMSRGQLDSDNAWTTQVYTFAIQAADDGQSFTATATGNLDGDPHLDVLMIKRVGNQNE